MDITDIKDIENIKDSIKKSNSIFVFSSDKQSSKYLFEELIKDKEILDGRTILVENITGSRGKVLFMAQKFKKKVIIGGYDFYFNLIGSGIKFDKLIIYDLDGPMKEVMVKDLKLWRI